MNSETSPVTPGWKLVPVEPTEEMVSAALDCQDADPADGPGAEVYCGWKAMLAAAPTPLLAVEEREAFEKWAQTQGTRETGWWLRQLPDGGYSSGLVDDAWQVWQAARAQDSFHLAAPQTEAKSLQPLLDAPLVEDVACAIYDQWRNIDGWVAWEERGNSIKQDEARRIARIALGNRTPARQEERSSEKEVGAAPLPVQGQDGAMVKQPYAIEGLAAAVAYGDNPEVAVVFDTPAQAHGFVNYLKRFIEPVAALRASSAPTTKG